MRWAVLIAVLLVVSCGDGKDPPAQHDASPLIDALPDAPPGGCIYPSDCTDPAQPVCCVFMSPGGASYAGCATSVTGCKNYGSPACQPGEPCEDATLTCQYTELSFGKKYWLCR